VVLATGTRARIPDVPGLREARPWTNREGTGAKRVPRRLLVVGGGAVGVELAQAWRSLGSEEVTLVHRGAHLLERLEPFATRAVTRALTDDGVRLQLGCSLQRVQRERPGGEVTALLTDGFQLHADELLIALGREPATEDLGLESVGLTPGKSVEVDDSLRVKGVDWLYACGDVNGRNLLTHMGKYQAHVLGEVLAGRSVRAWADARATPQILFTHPEVASVGLTEAAARKAGLRVRCAEVTLESAAGAGLMGEGVHGQAKWVVDEARRVLVGATLVGPGVGELLHASTVAIAGELSVDTLWHAVPCFPSVSEVWLRLLEALPV
jgi:pyruvate/2-oxoglutarate dehydrogenase complex dihydrolipoamide dehydrogenase (E3) component